MIDKTPLNNTSTRSTRRMFNKVDFNQALACENQSSPYCLIQYKAEFYLLEESFSTYGGVRSSHNNQLVIRGELDVMQSKLPAFMPSNGNIKYTVITDNIFDLTSLKIEVV